MFCIHDTKITVCLLFSICILLSVGCCPSDTKPILNDLTDAENLLGKEVVIRGRLTPGVVPVLILPNDTSVHICQFLNFERPGPDPWAGMIREFIENNYDQRTKQQLLVVAVGTLCKYDPKVQASLRAGYFLHLKSLELDESR